MVVILNDELYHYGILGQKWGKRNGPPYPLKASDHSASEKKAGWKRSLKKSEAVDSFSTKPYNDGGKKIRNGKAIAKKVLIGVGAVTAGVAIASIFTSSGANYGAEDFDDDAYKKSLMLRYSGSNKKLFSKDGRRIIPNQDFPRVMKAVKEQMPSGLKNGERYYASLDTKVYVCEKAKNDTVKVLDWYDLSSSSAESTWEELNEKETD